MTSIFISFFFLIIAVPFRYAWHQTLTFEQQFISQHRDRPSDDDFQEMKFFRWHRSWAIFGARQRLIFVRPNLTTSSVEQFSYDWPVDLNTLNECVEEWNSKEQCYNDIIHVRINENDNEMEVWANYAHRSMIRSFDFQSMSFMSENSVRRDLHPPIDSERSFVMLNFNRSFVTAGYQGDYIPTVRASEGKTLLYALRQNSFFLGGFPFENKAVFGVVEPSERSETNLVSRLVMACANRAEIIRKATLNCSTNIFDRSRSFVFNILTSLVEPIRVGNNASFLFASFTSDNSSITASAVCLFRFDRDEFYRVFAGPSKKHGRTNEFQALIEQCSTSIPSSIDREMVESEREFLPYRSSPLIIETMSKYRFTALDLIQHRANSSALIIGTSHGHLLSIFLDENFQVSSQFQELTLPLPMQRPIKSIVHQKIDEKTYVILISNSIGYFTLRFDRCNNDGNRFCFHCVTDDCSMELVRTANSKTENQLCSYATVINQTDSTMTNRPSSDGRSTSNALFIIIVIPLSILVCLLSVFVVILLKKSSSYRKTHCLQSENESKTTNDSIFYRRERNRSFLEKKSLPETYPNQSEICINRLNSNPIYSTASSQSLPSLVISSSPSILTSNKIQPLSLASRCYKSYV